ncbi:unnamed protein product [Toxocara canis]|uniref:Uncharacterized protein n=1 Tax=Toxocara canis TaxID=6265 RepID=A0A183V9J0_TOXCA|nr:unnamed protein product [Toxocara canis]
MRHPPCKPTQPSPYAIHPSISLSAWDECLRPTVRVSSRLASAKPLVRCPCTIDGPALPLVNQCPPSGLAAQASFSLARPSITTHASPHLVLG